MTEDTQDLADFELVIVNDEGDEELAAACSGPREESLREILHYFAQFAGQDRRLYEVTRIRVDLKGFGDESAHAGLILPPGVQ
jgi:hypothetical protein